MKPIPSKSGHDDEGAHVSERYLDEPSTSNDAPAASISTASPEDIESTAVVYKVYKRRWFGLIQLVLLNIIVSWDWLTYAPVSTTSAEYFNVSISAVNWLSTLFLFAFVVATPLVIYTLNRGGPKPSIVTASALILAGNWVRYAGTRARQDGASGGVFGVVLLGQILIGFAQPFVLAAPTRYSELWFTEQGRISATAVASLANPLGGALGQLIDPFWATSPDQIPSMTLWVAIISTAAALPSLFIPSAPPTPPSPASSLSKPPITLHTLRTILLSPTFWLLFLPFSIYVGLFNAFSSLLNQILSPYAFSETAAGLTGALLILVGLVASAITSPLLDRSPRLRLPALRGLVPVIAAAYVAFVWAPQTRGVAAPYAVSAVLGAASFSLVPLALELLVDFTWPVSPEVGSCVCWAGGQLLGGVFIVIMDALVGVWRDGPAGNMKAALVFQAVVAAAVAPVPLFLGYFGTGKRAREDAGKRAAAVDEDVFTA